VPLCAALRGCVVTCFVLQCIVLRCGRCVGSTLPFQDEVLTSLQLAFQSRDMDRAWALFEGSTPDDYAVQVPAGHRMHGYNVMHIAAPVSAPGLGPACEQTKAELQYSTIFYGPHGRVKLNSKTLQYSAFCCVAVNCRCVFVFGRPLQTSGPTNRHVSAPQCKSSLAGFARALGRRTVSWRWARPRTGCRTCTRRCA
jgi:hypothetical protein